MLRVAVLMMQVFLVIVMKMLMVTLPYHPQDLSQSQGWEQSQGTAVSSRPVVSSPSFKGVKTLRK